MNDKDEDDDNNDDMKAKLDTLRSKKVADGINYKVTFFAMLCIILRKAS